MILYSTHPEDVNVRAKDTEREREKGGGREALEVLKVHQKINPHASVSN